jgi:DAK2 domain fusion protein YloV
MAEVCQAVAHGSLMGARGNSGVILSQVLRGLADTFRNLESAGPSDFAAGMRRASDAAYEAVMRPVEGTILTVVRATAEAAEAARDAGEQALEGMLDTALAAAVDAVARTPELLPVLKEAGVVDAGGRGFTLLLDALLEVVAGRPIPEPEEFTTPYLVEAHLAGSDLASLRYEVMYLLDAEDSTIDGFKQTWAALGDSIVVVGGDGLWNCHVHTDDIGGAIEAGIEAGRPRQIRVTDLLEQVEEEQWVRDEDPKLAGVAAENRADDRQKVATAVVAVGVGEGIRRLLVSLGVQEIVAGGQSMNPSTAQILEAVERCPSDSVVILPNNKNIVPVAKQVDGLTSRHVAVIPTTSVLEALSALMAYDPQAEMDDNVRSMSEAAGRVATGEVTQAVRDSVAECGPIAVGDWLAIKRDGICATATNPVDAALAVAAGLITADSEIVTVLVGAEARSADTERVRQQVALAHSHVEVEVHEGGQPLYPYLIGVE